MGQYYKAVVKHESEGARGWRAFDSWSFDNGAKLMEHSYINNRFVSFVKMLIFGNPMQVVWAGDYADNERKRKHNLYELAKDGEKEPMPTQEEVDGMHYLVNHTKKLYVNYKKVKKDKWGYRIDPLPLLTAEGNGRGGGDYNGRDMKLIGSWARDMISVESVRPSRKYKQLVPLFKEGAEDDIIAVERLKPSNPQVVAE